MSEKKIIKSQKSVSSDKEHINAVFKKVSRKDSGATALNDGLYDMIARLAIENGYKKAGFVQEMVIAGILSCPMFSEQFENMLAKTEGVSSVHLHVFVDRVRVLLNRGKSD